MNAREVENLGDEIGMLNSKMLLEAIEEIKKAQKACTCGHSCLALEKALVVLQGKSQE